MRDPRDRNMDAIRAEVAARRLPERALFIATLTALAESDLYRYSNPIYPLSSQVPNDGAPRWSTSTKNSLGLFQQRLEYWGTGTQDMRVRQLMDARTSCGLFLAALVMVPHWDEIESWTAAQAVQRSEFADGSNYRDRLAQADRVIRGGPTFFTDGGV